MTAIQTLSLFATGYLVSRLLLTAELHRELVERLLRRAKGRVSHVVLGVMLLAFFMSMVVPNALTVLALLPVLAHLRRLAGPGLDPSDPGTHRSQQRGEPPYYATLLAMGLIYGANLGGAGSLLGSPANLYLLISLHLYDVPGRESLHFVSWLLFGLPMALSLLLLCWGVLRLTVPAAMAARLPPSHPTPQGVEASLPSAQRNPRRRPALRLGLAWLLGWGAIIAAGLLLGRRHHPSRTATPELTSGSLLGQGWAITWLDAVALLLAAVFVAAVFLWRVPTTEGPRPLFKPRDLTREMPWKGLLVAAAVLGLLALVAQSGVVGYLRNAIPSVLPQTGNPFLFSLVLVTVTIFATEVLNNTTVSTVLFPVAAAAAPAMGADPLTTMLGISLASTCAFMTPVATPVNALALASLRGVSLRRFLFCGLWVNLMAVLWISVFITWVVPPILRLFGGP